QFEDSYKNIIGYGKTRENDDQNPSSTNKKNDDIDDDNNTNNVQNNSNQTLLQKFYNFTLPKNWFSHFYFIGTVLASHLFMDILVWYQKSRPLPGGKTPTPVHWPILANFDLIDFLMRFEKQFSGEGAATGKIFVDSPDTFASLLVIGLYNVHVYIRLYECATKQPASKARMHIGGYIVGVLFYLISPIAVFIDSIYAAAESLSSASQFVDQASSTPGTINTIHFAFTAITAIAGIWLFFYAKIHQWRCHSILFNLRERQKQDMTQTSNHSIEYGLPTGDLFDYLTCPHYFCDILVYLALYTLSGFKNTSCLCVMIWTIANLSASASKNHEWYQKTFGDRYPKSRYRIIPYIY
ncbi:hypothetical protein H4219_006234, partial [Mycoemilia scoparia]